MGKEHKNEIMFNGECLKINEQIIKKITNNK